MASTPSWAKSGCSRRTSPGSPTIRGITVPAIVDATNARLVTNDLAEMTIDLSLEWTAHHREGAPEPYPAHLRDEMHVVMKGCSPR